MPPRYALAVLVIVASAERFRRRFGRAQTVQSADEQGHAAQVRDCVRFIHRPGYPADRGNEGDTGTDPSKTGRGTLGKQVFQIRELAERDSKPRPENKAECEKHDYVKHGEPPLFMSCAFLPCRARMFYCMPDHMSLKSFSMLKMPTVPALYCRRR